ncbi:MAG: hypothetical protein ACI85O_000131 [Saprospiraceae bacterium]
MRTKKSKIMSLGKYDFLPWSRRGIVSQIKEKDTLGKSEGTATERAELEVETSINNGDILEKHTFKLYGAADVTGIKSDAIIRTEPLDGISNYEPNLLPYIEFYDEDFPWRYTPATAAPKSVKLRPWLALIVLTEKEFEMTKRREPLQSINILNPGVLPPHDELHLWAHTHSNLPTETGAFSVFMDNLEEDAKKDPDGLYSRILSPRKLEVSTRYHAFLVPTYETGRLTGLGQPIAGVKAQKSSWPGNGNEFPYYYRWHFNTGRNFDFESLVKLLKPRIMDKKIGTREMDCSRPGYTQATSTREISAVNPEIMLLEGALKAPNAEATKIADTNQPFFEEVKDLLNLNLVQVEKPDEDPYVTIPFYGMHHAKRKLGNKEITPEFSPNTDKWQNELNRDPRHRVPAGFGVLAVQENQEKLMDDAWEQLEEVIKANRLIAQSKLAEEVTKSLKKKTIDLLKPEVLLSFTSQLTPRVRLSNKTAFQAIRESKISEAFFDAAYRRMTRSNTSMTRALNNTAVGFSAAKTVLKVNKNKKLAVAPPVKIASVMDNHPINKLVAPINFDELTAYTVQSNLEATYVTNISMYNGGEPAINSVARPITQMILEDAGVRFVPVPAVSTARDSSVIVSPAAVDSIGLRPVSVRGNSGRILSPLRGRAAAPISTTTGNINLNTLNTSRDSIRATVKRDVISPVIFTGLFEESTVLNHVIGSANVEKRGQFTFSPTVASDVNRKEAIDTASARYEYKSPTVIKNKLNIKTVTKEIKKVISPKNSYRRLLGHRIKWSSEKKIKEEILPVMAYPDIALPTYKYLVEKDKEFLLPNLDLIPQNTLSLLQTNQKFIESYLVGLNYEMGRELLWREFPTDLRGSYFRQFWDTEGLITPDTNAEDSEALKDVKPLHTWQNKLGLHNARDAQGDDSQLVFVIRGDLLKKFPNTVIYAQKAHKDGKNKKIKTKLSDTEFDKEIRFPQYQAQLPPDIKLLGFDLTIEEATGTKKTPGFSDKKGWFFVIAEVPGEPRFGMDIKYDPSDPDEHTWDDLSWENLPEQGSDFIRENIKPGNTGQRNGKFSPPKPKNKKGAWGKSSADMAAILFQRPVMVAIHASEMLEQKASVDILEIDLKTNGVSLLEFMKPR